MSDEQTNQPSRAEEYRKASADYATTRVQLSGSSFENLSEFALRSSVTALWAIAAELAEANSRDREAEIRAKSAEAIVAMFQQELARQQIVIPGGVQVKPPRGR